MARVPTQTGRRSFTDPAAGRTPINPRQIESSYARIGKAVEEVRGAVGTALADEGCKEGEKAVGRDADGNLTVERPGFLGVLLPEYAEARRQGAMAAYLAESEVNIREKLSELRKNTPTDAVAFNTAALAFARGLRDNDKSGFSAEVFALATREAERVSRGIQATADRVELQKQEGALRASIAAKEDDLLALARTGGTDTQDFLELSAAYRDQMGILVNNPLFGFSEEEADLRVRSLQSRAKLEASSRDVMGVYGAKGEAAAVNRARTIADNIPGLTDAQREEWVADQRQLINEREAARNKAEARMRRINGRRIDDAVATLAAGNDASSLLNDPNLFVGFKPDEVQLAQEELAAAKRAGQARKALQGADPAKRAEILNSFKVEGPGAALTARYRASLESEASAVARRLDKDPVAQVAQSDPDLVDELGTALQEGDVDAFADAAASLIEEQTRLGAFNPRLLSEAQRRAMAANIIGDEGDENRVANMVEQIDRLSSVSGAHFPRLMAELAQEDDFPAAAWGVGLLEGKEHAQFLLAKAAAEDPKVLRENVGKLGTGSSNKLRDEIAAQTRPLVESLAASGASQTYIAKVTESVEALASQFAVEQGKVGGAAKKAYKAMFGDYHFEGSYRVPASRDPDLVRLGTRDMMARLEADDFIVPNADPRVTPEAAGRSYVSHLKSFGEWVTNRDETGLILTDGAGEFVMVRPLNPGEAPEPFEVSFDQLEALGQGRGEETKRKVRRLKGAFPD